MLLSFSGSSTDFTSEIKNLYNGNIACMINGMPDDNMGNMSSIANVYNYDALNRIKKYMAFTQGDANNSIFANNMVATDNKKDKYLSNYIYDGNGNIMNLSRNGNVLASLDMDNMEYSYSASGGTWGTIIKDNNQLYSVSDLTADGSYNDAFKQGQLVGNYDYFDNGQLKADVQEKIEEIHWNAAGKVTWIEPTQAVPGTNDRIELEFKYDAMGQRIMKRVTTIAGAITSTYYSRDASGNVMATYNVEEYTDNSNNYLKESLKELPIYGSARLGMKIMNLVTADNNPAASLGVVESVRSLGSKYYELTNHLSNVLAVVSDRAIPMGSGSSVDYYRADIVSANDYYPFGMLMPGRKFNSPSYRYGFNGMEKDDEVKGGGNSYDFGARIYDSRINKFLSLDPLINYFPSSTPYLFAHNNPILLIDYKGLTGVLPADKYSNVAVKLVHSHDLGDYIFIKIAVTHKYLDGKTKTVYLTTIRYKQWYIPESNPYFYRSIFTAMYPVIAHDAGIRLAAAVDVGSGWKGWLFNSPNTHNSVTGIFTEGIVKHLGSTGKKFASQLSSGYGKVFRHQIYSGLLYDIYGEEMAKKIGNYNEMGTKSEFGAMNKNGIRGSADLLNNAYGINKMKSFLEANGSIKDISDFTKYLNYISSSITDYEEFNELKGASIKFSSESKEVKRLYKTYKDLKKKNNETQD